MQALTTMRNLGFPLEGVLHVGANEGQERNAYLESGANPCVYVEPIDSVYANLKNNIVGLPGHVAVQAVCADLDGAEVEFNIASNAGLSSSLLPLGAHAEFHPSITYTSKQKMRTTTVDKLIEGLTLDRMPNLMIVDTQGTELKVLRGARRLLQDLDGVFAEVSEKPLYDGGCTLDEVSEFLKDYGFRVRWLELDRNGHGDAFYARGVDFADALPTYNGNLALGLHAKQSSLSPWSKPADASGALTGRRTGGFGFHTDFEDAPWWQVDLGKVRRLNEIRVFNRIDAGRERARSLRVFVSNGEKQWTLVHDQNNRQFGGLDGRPLRVLCPEVKARYVRLQLAERTALHLDQVEIY